MIIAKHYIRDAHFVVEITQIEASRNYILKRTSWDETQYEE